MMSQANREKEMPNVPYNLAGLLRKWATLLAGLAVVWAFIFVIAPQLQKNELVRPLAEYVRESGIEASALYYTGVKETGEAEIYLRDAFAYSPTGP